jgi:putative hemolysin
MNEEKKITQIDIDAIIGSKNPRLLKLLPGFVLNYIKKILHQEDVNLFLRNHHSEMGLDFVRSIISEFNITVSSSGLENLPATGGCILASNHPLGGLDAIPLMNEVSKVRTDMKFLVNDILMNLENLGPVFVPINKHGKNAAESVRRIAETYASDQCTMIFPAGLVSRRQGSIFGGKTKVIRDLEWHKSFITQSVKNRRNVIPVFIEALNSPFFYNFAFWRKKLGIPVNLEMFFLVNEMYKQRNKLRIIFGEAIPFATFTKDRTDREWANEVKTLVYALKK